MANSNNSTSHLADTSNNCLIHNNPYLKNADRGAYELGGLLRSLPPTLPPGAKMSIDERQKAHAAITHAGNVSTWLIDGMESLGELLFIAGANEDQQLESNHLRNIGMLIKNMAVETQFLLDQREDLQSHLDATGMQVAPLAPSKKAGAA